MSDRRMQSKSLEETFGFETTPEKEPENKESLEKAKKKANQEKNNDSKKNEDFPENDPTEHINPDDPRERNQDRKAEKVHEITLEKEDGYLYFVDKDGDVARVPSKWNKDPRFLEKVKHDEQAVDRKLEQMKSHYAQKEEPHHDPIPKESPNIPDFFANKDIFYFDKAVIGTLNDSAISKANVKIWGIEPFDYSQVPQFVHNLTVSSFTASILFEGLKAQGTNIITNFDKSGRAVTSVIPRFENDGLQLMWDMKQGDQKAIKAMAEKIKAAFVVGEIKNFNKVNLDEPEKKTPRKVNIIDTEEVEKEEKKINHMVEHISERWA